MNEASSEAACEAVKQCQFAVTIADPSAPDVPLIAASPGFEQVTGYSCQEVVGANCRFLSHGCENDWQVRCDLRRATQTGRPCRVILRNRRKNGQEFTNVLDLRGLKVAKDLETGEDIWYLVGIQTDISAQVDTHATQEHADIEVTTEFHRQVADRFRSELVDVFAKLARCSGRGCQQGATETSLSTDCTDVFRPADGVIQTGPKPRVRPQTVIVDCMPEWIADEPRYEPAGSSRGYRDLVETACLRAHTIVQSFNVYPLFGAAFLCIVFGAASYQSSLRRNLR
jgi:PAS domain S-box-containing protein